MWTLKLNDQDLEVVVEGIGKLPGERMFQTGVSITRQVQAQNLKKRGRRAGREGSAPSAPTTLAPE